MYAHDKVLYLEVMDTLGEAFQREITDALLQIYWTALRDLSIEQFRSAAMMSIQCETFFPKVATLRRFAGASLAAPLSQAEAAWIALRRTNGPRAYNPEALTDPITHLVFRRMGMSRGFGTWDYEKEEAWRRREFIEHYSEIERQHTHPRQPEVKQILDQLGLKPKTFDGKKEEEAGQKEE